MAGTRVTGGARDPLEVVLRPSAELDDGEVAALFAAAWPGGAGFSFEAARQHSLCWVSAHVKKRLVGFVNVAWDGGVHAFLLDTTVHPDYRRRGVGAALVRCATDEARELGAEIVHVDYVPALSSFYQRCGFRPTRAGLMHLTASMASTTAAPASAEWVLRRFAPADAPSCRELLAGLSDWFTTDAAVNAYIEDLPRTLTWVAAASDAQPRVLGLVSLTRPQPRSFEVHLLAVARDQHGRGLGRALLELGERFARSQDARFMLALTLSPARPDPFYEKTRGFYQRLGYEPLFESERLWGEGNPSLVLVKSLA